MSALKKVDAEETLVYPDCVHRKKCARDLIKETSDEEFNPSRDNLPAIEETGGPRPAIHLVPKPDLTLPVQGQAIEQKTTRLPGYYVGPPMEVIACDSKIAVLKIGELALHGCETMLEALEKGAGLNLLSDHYVIVTAWHLDKAQEFVRADRQKKLAKGE